ncbi:hypothetical protein QE152_g34882 [Popillia japonica]|uniref:Uncharacterized protein n=1 Tax=Popillia japonica TaxID=7064 RepID=A0AAW1ITE2_POPJA
MEAQIVKSPVFKYILKRAAIPLKELGTEFFMEAQIVKSPVFKYILKRAAISEEVIDNFSQHYENAVQNANPQCIVNFSQHYENAVQNANPQCIVNYNKTNLTDDPCFKKCICRRGSRYAERIINGTNISIMYAAAADGLLLPPYVVYRVEHMWGTWRQAGLIMYAAAADGLLLPPYVVYRVEHMWGTWRQAGLQHASTRLFISSKQSNSGPSSRTTRLFISSKQSNSGPSSRMQSV